MELQQKLSERLQCKVCWENDISTVLDECLDLLAGLSTCVFSRALSCTGLLTMRAHLLLLEVRAEDDQVRIVSPTYHSTNQDLHLS